MGKHWWQAASLDFEIKYELLQCGSSERASSYSNWKQGGWMQRKCRFEETRLSAHHCYQCVSHSGSTSTLLLPPLCKAAYYPPALSLWLVSQSRSPWRGVFEPSLSLTSHGSGLPLQRLERGSGCAQICCSRGAGGARLEDGGGVEEGDKRWRFVSSLSLFFRA